MTTSYHLTHAAELCSTAGPTGRFVEVLAGEVRDHGGNVLFSGTADECVAQQFLFPVRFVPTEWRDVPGEVAGADHTWQWIVA